MLPVMLVWIPQEFNLKCLSFMKLFCNICQSLMKMCFFSPVSHQVKTEEQIAAEQAWFGSERVWLVHEDGFSLGRSFCFSLSFVCYINNAYLYSYGIIWYICFVSEMLNYYLHDLFHYLLCLFTTSLLAVFTTDSSAGTYKGCFENIAYLFMISMHNSLRQFS